MIAYKLVAGRLKKFKVVVLVYLFFLSTFLTAVLSEENKKAAVAKKEVNSKTENKNLGNKWTGKLSLRDFYVNPTYLELKNKLQDKEYLEHVEKNYKDHPTVFSAVIEYGLLLTDLGRFDEAKIIWDNAVLLFKSNMTPKVYKAWVDACNGDYLASKEAWMLVVKEMFNEKGEIKFGMMWMPYHLDALLGLYLIKDNLPEDQKKEAEEIVLKIAKTLPRNLKLSAILVSDYLQNGELTQVAENLADVLGQNPDEPIPVTLLGIAQLLKGYDEDALKLFDKAIELRPNSPTSHLMKARALYKLNKKKESNQQIDIAIKLDPMLKNTEKVKLLDPASYIISSNKL